MSDIKFLKPKPGIMVRDPITFAPLNSNGETKEMNRYWRGALRDGDVEVCDPQPDSLTTDEKENE